MSEGIKNRMELTKEVLDSLGDTEARKFLAIELVIECGWNATASALIAGLEENLRAPFYAKLAGYFSLVMSSMKAGEYQATIIKRAIDHYSELAGPVLEGKKGSKTEKKKKKSK